MKIRFEHIEIEATAEDLKASKTLSDSFTDALYRMFSTAFYENGETAEESEKMEET